MLRILALLMIVSFSTAALPGPTRMITICAGGETREIPDPDAPAPHHHDCCLAVFDIAADSSLTHLPQRVAFYLADQKEQAALIRFAITEQARDPPLLA